MARVKTRVAIVAASLVALAAAAGVLARPRRPPDPLQQATADGCERNDTTLHTLQSPNWVYVNDKDYPASGPAPPLKTVSGVVQRDPLGVHTSGGDNPVSHAAYDLNFDVSVDSADADLVAKTNTSGGLHVEREEAAVPTYVWPEPGDRVTLRGSGSGTATTSRPDPVRSRARRRSSIPGRRSGSSARSPRAAEPASARSISTSRATRPRPASPPTARTATKHSQARSRRASSSSRNTPT